MVPPYDLKVNEQNSAKWESNVFLGRPEPVYTYQNAERGGTVTFKVVVDHPSILNLLVQNYFKDMSDEEADNYINAFFAGCVDVDFYGLIRKYATLTPTDIQAIQAYLNQNKDPNTIKRYQTLFIPASNTPTPTNSTDTSTIKALLFYNNDIPSSNGNSLYTNQNYEQLYNLYTSDAGQAKYFSDLNIGLNNLITNLPKPNWSENQQNDCRILTGGGVNTKDCPTDIELANMTGTTISAITNGFARLTKEYTDFKSSSLH